MSIHSVKMLASNVFSSDHNKSPNRILAWLPLVWILMDSLAIVCPRPINVCGRTHRANDRALTLAQ